jgi:hypothetical protein
MALTSWNPTVNELESICVGYNHTILFLDETGTGERPKGAPVDTLDAVMRLDGGIEKGRMNADGPRKTWHMPILSTSNVSVGQMALARQAKEKNKKDHRVFCDRLIDIPIPIRGLGMFEVLHGYEDVGKFSTRLKALAAKNHGWAGREFVRRMLKKRAEDEQKLLADLEASKNGYLDKAKEQIQLPDNKTRIHDKFATVYAAGVLAISERVLPFTPPGLLSAILKCEKDHIRYIEDELAGIAQSQESPIDCLRAYIQDNRRKFTTLISMSSLTIMTINPALVILVELPMVEPGTSFQKKSCRKLWGPGSCRRSKTPIGRQRTYKKILRGRRGAVFR